MRWSPCTCRAGAGSGTRGTATWRSWPRDVRDGCVSRERAEVDYGVVLTEGSFEVDAQRTAAVRKKQR